MLDLDDFGIWCGFTGMEEKLMISNKLMSSLSVISFQYRNLFFGEWL